MTNLNYIAFLQYLNFDHLECECPYPYIMQRMRDAYRDDYESFVAQFDFVAMELPLDPMEYSNEDWIAIGDVLEEILTEIHSYSGGCDYEEECFQQEMWR